MQTACAVGVQSGRESTLDQSTPLSLVSGYQIIQSHSSQPSRRKSRQVSSVAHRQFLENKDRNNSNIGVAVKVECREISVI